MYIANTLLPLFLIIALGLILRRTGFVPENMFKQANRLVYWVALPCLLLIKTSEIAIQGSAAFRLSAVLFCSMGVVIATAYLAGWLIRVPRASLGAVVQGAFRGNLVYVGLPVIYFSMATNGTHVPPAVEALAIVPIAPLVIAYNVISIPVLLQPHKNTDRPEHTGRIRHILVNLITNPLLIAVGLGTLINLSGLRLPLFIQRSCSTIGQLALPLALLGVGASLRWRSIHKGFIYALLSSVIKTGAAPVAGYFIGAQAGLTPDELKIALIFLACPTAVASFIMAEQLNGDAELTGSIIMLSTLLSFLSFTVILLRI